jgi:predicted DNA-binding transcriptional regulator AlpA
MIAIIRTLLLDCINRIDSGNSNITEEEGEKVITFIKKFINKDRKLSKYQACKYLNISRATFDKYIREGKLPKGKKEAGFKELFWEENVLRKYLYSNK